MTNYVIPDPPPKPTLTDQEKVLYGNRAPPGYKKIDLVGK
jgi:hypothetical protein